MQKLRSLGVVAAAAFIVATVYAFAVNDNRVDVSLESEDGRSIRHVMSGDEGEFRFRDDDIALTARWRGDFNLGDDGNAIASLQNELEIELEEDETEERAVYEDRRGEIRKRYFRDGEEIEDDTEADAAAKALLIRFLRISGLEAEDRTAALIAQGGTAAAIEEIALLESDIAVRRYVQALSEDHALTEEDLAAIARKLKGVESDQDLRLALNEIFENQSVSPAMAAQLLDTALGVESNHDLRKLLESAASAPIAEDEPLSIALRLYGRIESDHDLRKAGEALLKTEGLSAAGRAQIIAAAASRIESDHDLRLLLERSAESLSDDTAVTTAWLSGFEALQSGRDQRLAVEAAAAGDLNDDAARMLIERIAAIEDDREKRLALEAVAAIAADAQALSEAYRNAADSIEDERERERARAALSGGD